jgi:hypothetical protein
VGSLGHVVFMFVCHDNLFFRKIYFRRGGLPLKEGNMPLFYLLAKAPNVSGGAPNVSGGTPNVFGEAPNISGRAPNISGGTPNVFGEAPNISGGAPNVFGRAPNTLAAAPGILLNSVSVTFFLPSNKRLFNTVIKPVCKEMRCLCCGIL